MAESKFDKIEMKALHLLNVIAILFRLSNSARILGFFTHPSISHQQTFRAIWKALALKGHEVTVVSPNILNDTNIRNLKEIDISYLYGLTKNADFSLLMKSSSQIQKVLFYNDFMKAPAVGVLENEEVRKLIASDEDFDVVLVQAIHPILFSIASKFSAPTVGE